MTFIRFILIIEILILNTYSLLHCCHRKYSLKRTVIVLLVFSAAFFSAGFLPFRFLTVRLDGRFMLTGFLYLIPLYYLLKEKLSVLFTLMCSCWVYTLGVFIFSAELTEILAPGSEIFTLGAQSLIFCATFYLFQKHMIAKYIFVLQNMSFFEKRWNKYIVLNSGFYFLTLVLLNNAFLSGNGSLLRLASLLLLMAGIFLSHYIFYMLILDSIRLSQLKHRVCHDSLTGLRNRMQLWDDLDACLKTRGAFSVLFMDLDHFKQINDQYGHMTGDLYLQHFADTSVRIIGIQGKLYRFGGDEFIAIYDGDIPRSVIESLEECRGWDADAPCPFNHVSIGFLLCEPPHRTDVDTIMHRVDALMYQQKKERHNL